MPEQLIQAGPRRDHGSEEQLVLGGETLEDDAFGNAGLARDRLGGGAESFFYENLAGDFEQRGIGYRLLSTHGSFMVASFRLERSAWRAVFRSRRFQNPRRADGSPSSPGQPSGRALAMVRK